MIFFPFLCQHVWGVWMAASFPCCPRSQAAPAPGRERDPELRGDAGVTLGAPGRGRIIFLTCEERLSSTPWLLELGGWKDAEWLQAGVGG